MSSPTLRAQVSKAMMVFATRKTEEALEGAGGVEWAPGVAIPGSQQGVLLVGRRVI